jgi:hypothetical protein
MATPITRAEVLNLIQSKSFTNGAGSAKKGVCQASATNLDTGCANVQRTTRAKAGMATMGTKDQRMPSPESLLLRSVRT